ncbi:hypothetical protein BKA65DRAFT_494730 [Rhexocercosporidium sp. MPI-PUGE-AT-0058]|nr:hypothetical protein BKA65DRAFT_494730 [Rhexocercosporidium sp. MPI-PUGE-AT-0058]
MTGTFGDNIAINHTGTVEQILAQLASENPHVDFSNPFTTGVTTGVVEDSHISKRVHSDVNCIPVLGQTWKPAKMSAIEDGINFLNHVQAMCRVASHSCARVSCSFNSGIHLCNNNDYSLVKSCVDIATYAQAISDKCRYWITYLNIGETGGQAWDTENFNICVYSERCAA